jgi:hypothetical protein
MGHNHIHTPVTRREFLTKTSLGIGAVSFASLLNPTSLFASDGGPHFVPKAKRIIYLYMNGAPSQLDLFDYKPQLIKRNGQNLPSSILGDRVTGTAAAQNSLPMVGSP